MTTFLITMSQTIGHSMVDLVVTGLLYVAYSNGCRHKCTFTFMPRLRPLSCEGASALVRCSLSSKPCLRNSVEGLHM